MRTITLFVAALVLLAVPAFCPAAETGQKIVYSNDFEKSPEGQAPADMLILAGEFTVTQDGPNRCLSVSPTPLDSFGLLFGPEETPISAVSARIRATATGRRFPEFGVGLRGSGYKLWLMPAVGQLQLRKGENNTLQASLPYSWTSGTWTHLRLRLQLTADNKCLVEGKAWPAGQPEPHAWTIRFEDPAPPPSGRPSLWATPYSETPVHFDDLTLTDQ